MRNIFCLLGFITLLSCSISNSNVSSSSQPSKAPIESSQPVSDIPKTTDFSFGTDFKVKNGQSINLKNGYSIKFENLVEDSRCPKNVTCIQAGRAVIELSLLKDKEQTTVTLSTDKNTQIVNGYNIILKDVNTPTKSSEYEIVLNVQEAKSTTNSTPLGSLPIQNDINEYTPVMSSTVGIGLTPVYTLNREPSSVNFLWKTNFGRFLSWEAPDFKVKDLGKEVTYTEKKIYWSYSPEDFNKQKTNVKVTLSLLDKALGNVIMDSSIEIEVDEKGMARVKK